MDRVVAGDPALRNEVGIENADKITLGRGQPGLERARLEADAIDAVDQLAR